MRISRMLRSLLVLPLGIFGCSQPWGVRPNSADSVKTVASVGDRSMPIRSGTPDSAVQADEREPLVTSSSRVRISGRVYDVRGKPVPGAKVRLAVGGEAGGKALVATTDPSGAFTLRGLRTGSSYTLIAEYEGQGGSAYTGRIDTEAPDTNVRISLKRKVDAPLDDERSSSVRPARPGVAPISNIEEVDDDREPAQSSVRLNREDLEPPAPEAEEASRDSQGKGTRSSAAVETGTRGSGWTSGHQSGTGSKAEQGGASKSGAEEGRLPRPRDAQAEDDEVNPLPPALDPGPVGSQDDGGNGAKSGASSRRQLVMLAASPAPNQPAASAVAASQGDHLGQTDPAPQPLPHGVLPGELSASSEASAPIMLTKPATADRARAQSPRPWVSDAAGPGASLALKPASAAAAASSNSEPAQPRPTWGELVFAKTPIPLDESIRKASRAESSQAARRGKGRADGPGRNRSRHSGRRGRKLGGELRIRPDRADAQGLPASRLPRADGRLS